jgi:RimJ/RimL family protein N-acetyltransferase
MEPVTLTSERLVLRPFTPADADAVWSACQDPEIQRWTTVPSPYRREHAAGFVNQMVPDGWREGSDLAFAVCPGPDGPLSGVVALHRRGPRTYEVGFWAAREHRGRGYTAEAVTTAARWAFAELGCTRLEWRAHVGNTASRAVAEKAGFRYEGVLRAALEQRGTLRDGWVSALLPSDLGLPAPLPYLPSPSA